jgi:CRISPR-associated protein Cmr6
VTTWHTRPGKLIDSRESELSPSLLYHKWHAYDPQEGRFETEATRVEYLADVARAVEAARRRHYGDWRGRYVEALGALGAPESSWLRGSTAWRLVIGFATNPALESGLTLHPLLGFPYLPGSAVRGLVHHVAEMELLDALAASDDGELAAPPSAPELASFLRGAEQIWALFGSLCVNPIDVETWRRIGGGDVRAETPRSLLESWLENTLSRDESRRAQAERVRALLARHTGGMAAFYDAVPAADASDLLETDILNPHYPLFYDSKGASAPPSDDQDPRPVYFLTVRSGVSFGFPLRLARWPNDRSAQDEAATEQSTSLHGLTREDAGKLIRRWLACGLSNWGVGAKTAAGYGYFEVEDNVQGGPTATRQAEGGQRKQEATAGQRPATPPAKPAWETWVRGIRWGEAQVQVPRILAELEGQDRMRAALEIVKNLGRKKLLQRQDAWARDVLVAAGLE